VLESVYTLQLASISVVQPYLELGWNPAFRPDRGRAIVFPFQFVLKW
jgi:hypothetical protein